MLTYEQKKALCLLHNAITLDSLFEISPISRINMNAEVHCAPEKLMDMQMLHAHFQSFISENFSSYEEGIQMAESINKQLIGDLKYRSRTVLRNTIIECIERLLGPNPKYDSTFGQFIFGYSMYLPSRETKNKIGAWLASKDRSLYYTWNMF